MILQPSQATLAARLRTPGYILLVAMTCLPILDMLLMSWPVKAGQLAWRFGTFGQLSATAAAPIIAILLLYALAYANGDRGMLYFCVTLSLFYALLLLAGLLSFPLDALQMRRRVGDAAIEKFTLASGAAELRLMIYLIGALTMAVSQMRSISILGKNVQRPLDATSGLVMRTLGPSRPTPSAGQMAVPPEATDSPPSAEPTE